MVRSGSEAFFFERNALKGSLFERLCSGFLSANLFCEFVDFVTRGLSASSTWCFTAFAKTPLSAVALFTLGRGRSELTQCFWGSENPGESEELRLEPTLHSLGLSPLTIEF